MAKPKKQTNSIISPAVVEEGRPHVLEALFDADDMPTLKSVGYVKLSDSNTWVSYVITSKGKDVLKIEAADPDVRSIAEDNAKASFVTELVDQDF